MAVCIFIHAGVDSLVYTIKVDWIINRGLKNPVRICAAMSVNI